MAEPLFFDCLTDAQLWSLFDMGVLHSYMLPVEVYERLERIAPDHGSYLFMWPAGVDLPSLHDIAPACAAPADDPTAQTPGKRLETRVTVQQMHSDIEAFCARVNTEIPPAGGRIHVISTHPRLELRTGPYLHLQARDLEPQPRDLHSMSLLELEAYLDDVLRVDEGNA